MKELSVSALVAVAIMVGGLFSMCYGAQLDVTWNPQPGDPILSSDIRTTISEVEASVNDQDATQHGDSFITSALMGNNVVGGFAISSRAIQPRHIDGGAINADTMFAVGALGSNAIADSAVTDTKIANNTIQWWDLHYSGMDTYNIRKLPMRMEILAWTGDGSATYTGTVTSLSKIVAVSVVNNNSQDLSIAGYDMNWIAHNIPSYLTISSDTQFTAESMFDANGNYMSAIVWGY